MRRFKFSSSVILSMVVVFLSIESLQADSSDVKSKMLRVQALKANEYEAAARKKTTNGEYCCDDGILKLKRMDSIDACRQFWGKEDELQISTINTHFYLWKKLDYVSAATNGSGKILYIHISNEALKTIPGMKYKMTYEEFVKQNPVAASLKYRKNGHSIFYIGIGYACTSTYEFIDGKLDEIGIRMADGI